MQEARKTTFCCWSFDFPGSWAVKPAKSTNSIRAKARTAHLWRKFSLHPRIQTDQPRPKAQRSNQITVLGSVPRDSATADHGPGSSRSRPASALTPSFVVDSIVSRPLCLALNAKTRVRIEGDINDTVRNGRNGVLEQKTQNDQPKGINC